MATHQNQEKELSAALKMNKHVPKYLTGEKIIPRILPDTISMGGEDEAYCYASLGIGAWKKVSGALDWLKVQTLKESLSIRSKR